MNIKLENLVWDKDSEAPNLPTSETLEVDKDFVEMMVEEGLELEQVLEDIIYEDLQDQYGATLISFDVVEVSA